MFRHVAPGSRSLSVCFIVSGSWWSSFLDVSAFCWPVQNCRAHRYASLRHVRLQLPPSPSVPCFAVKRFHYSIALGASRGDSRLTYLHFSKVVASCHFLLYPLWPVCQVEEADSADLCPKDAASGTWTVSQRLRLFSASWDRRGVEHGTLS